MYTFGPLNDVDLEQLTDCFNLAFSDYEQPIHLSTDYMRYYLTASAVDLSLSYGAFFDGALVALILNSSGVYKNQNVVFDAGTGVVPDHRSKKVFSALFDYTCQQLKSHGITTYYLEVLQSNQRAVDIYTKKGFSICCGYSVLTASGPRKDWERPVDAVAYEAFVPFETECSVEPSYEHSTYTISRNPQLYEVRYLPGLAYCIYAKRNGEIIQLHYNDLEALKDVLSSLIQQHPSAMAKNIDLNCPDVINVLTDIGFKEYLKQYEMAKSI